MSHTPGPWKRVDFGGGIERPSKGKSYTTAIMAGEKIIAAIDFDVTKCRGVRGDFTMFCDHRTGWDNANLIVAAPELLAALKGFVRKFDNSKAYRDPELLSLLSAAERAITNAGEVPNAD